MIDVDDDEVLFEIENNKIISYTVMADRYGFAVSWMGSKGYGEFSYNIEKDRLDTELMGREFCVKFMKEIFNNASVEYNE